MLWHVAQASPAPQADHAADELAERIGREIIRRWLKAAEPELYHDHGRSYYWAELCKLATFTPGDGEPGSPEWHNGSGCLVLPPRRRRPPTGARSSAVL
jgi:hypothetical protein